MWYGLLRCAATGADKPSAATAGKIVVSICVAAILSACSLPRNGAHVKWPIGPAQPRSAPELACPRPQARFASYDREVRDAFWQMHRDGGVTVYCGASFDGRSRRTATSALPVNIEHAVPQAHMKAIRAAGGDPHNLWPAILEVNAARQHWPLVEDIAGETAFFAERAEPELAACDFELKEEDDGAVVEPAMAARGPLARAILHMALAYPAIDRQAIDFKLLLAWHAAHPVTAHERLRNDCIEDLTGVRNRFIDFPDSGAALVQLCGQR